ncbi:hypothetical protein ABEB36_007674 [Hypothenemus hampei]|uniref:Fatty acyl-CoA reductase n=1 Tax=Hypothenemus hampei TaxID=57062 RepID=A0ABD1EUT0_HYPHA
MENREISQIQQFYKGVNVFITGGTGFLGKTLIEKLLRTTDVETVYVLIREKKGKTPHMRVDSLFDDVIFDRVKLEKPKCRNRVEAIAGDCSIAGLGISITDRQKLINNINLVFHAAATVNFNEQIKLAYDINVNGTKNILNLAREMKNLKSFVHVSTAYSNCNRKEIDEKIYEYSLKCSDVEAILEKMTEYESDLNTARLLGDWPNTYTFTKALGESLIKEMGKGLPIGIFRPSIVISTYKEPIPGWIDNLYGPTGIAVSTVSGILRVTFHDQTKIADLVPVDTCVSALLATSWDISGSNPKRVAEDIPVYNYVSSPENPIIWEEFKCLNLINGIPYTPSSSIWYPANVNVLSNLLLFKILTFFIHILPATVIDLFSILRGSKPRLFKIYKKIHKFSEALSYFSTREWKFSNNNVQILWDKMNKVDQKLFPMSMQTVSWLLFFKNYIRGVRKYILKESESNLHLCKTRNRRLHIAHQTTKILITWLGCTLLFNLIRGTLNLIFSIVFY